MTQPSEMTEENILARIPGQYIAQALNTLPNAEKAELDVMEVLIDIPNLGAVLITAKRMKHKKGKSRHYFWNADRAEPSADV
jgi:hypothetical protein